MALVTGMGEFCPQKYENWGKEAPGEGLTRAWTGMSPSSLSFAVMLMLSRHHGRVKGSSAPNRTGAKSTRTFRRSGIPRSALLPFYLVSRS